MDRTEEVTLIETGLKQEVKIGLLSFETKNNILSNCLTFSSKGQNLDIEKIDYFGLQTQILKATLRGVKVSEISDEDGSRIYQKYFGKLLEGVGGGDSKN